MSWHVDRDGHSFINDLINLTDNFLIEIVTDSEDRFTIWEDDEVIVGDGTILINHKTDNNKRYVHLLNANKIESIELKEYEDDEDVTD